MANSAYVTLTLRVDLDEARDLGLEISDKDDEVEYAKEDFIEFLRSFDNPEELMNNLEVELK